MNQETNCHTRVFLACDTGTRGRTGSDGSTIRLAENHWPTVLVRRHGRTRDLVVGLLTSDGIVTYSDGAELHLVQRLQNCFRTSLIHTLQENLCWQKPSVYASVNLVDLRRKSFDRQINVVQPSQQMCSQPKPTTPMPIHLFQHPKHFESANHMLNHDPFRR
jgi:formate dehydrogenase assembly factor FdhD